MKSKGFTLIELLAVIIILAVIALIATPLVMSTINDAKKGAAINSGYGFISAVENGLAVAMIQDTTKDYRNGSFTNGSFVNTNVSDSVSIAYKGTAPSTGYALTISNGVVAGGTMTINGFSLTVSANGSISAN